MSGAITAAAIGAVGAMAVNQLMAPKPQKVETPKLEAPPQASQLPDQAARRSQQQAAATGGYGPGQSNTMLTSGGAGGVDPNALLLGKNALLGQ